MALTARRLATIGHPSVQVITWPDAPEKGDGADFINGGGTAEGVRALIDSAAPFDGGVDAGGLVVVEAVDVEPRAVRWLWLSRVPMGGITMLDGDPGEGKTAIALKFSSLVSQGGLFPDDPTKREPRKVLYISVEDDPAFTLVPRLKSMGANLSNVAFLALMRDPKGEERVLDITRDLPELEAEVARRNPALIVIDPVQAHIGAGTDMNRVNQVRAAMAPVALLAAKYDCAILIVRHFNKQGGTKALYRGMGSIDFSGVGRAVLAAVMDEDERRWLTRVKCNLATRPLSVQYELGGQPFLRWGEIADVRADGVLNGGDSGVNSPEQARIVEALRMAYAAHRHAGREDACMTAKQIHEAAGGTRCRSGAHCESSTSEGSSSARKQGSIGSQRTTSVFLKEGLLQLLQMIQLLQLLQRTPAQE